MRHFANIIFARDAFRRLSSSAYAGLVSTDWSEGKREVSGSQTRGGRQEEERTSEKSESQKSQKVTKVKEAIKHALSVHINQVKNALCREPLKFLKCLFCGKKIKL